MGKSPISSHLSNLLLITLGHLLLAGWALQLTVQPENISLMWLPNGYLLGCLVLLPRSLWLPLCSMIFVATGSIELLTTDRPHSLTLSFQLANFLESIGGAILFLRFSGGKTGFTGYRHLTAFLFFAVLLLPGISAVFGASSVVYHGYTDQFWQVYRTWSFSAGLGNLFVAPFVIYVFSYWHKQQDRSTSSERYASLPIMGHLPGYSALGVTAIFALLIALIPSLFEGESHAKSFVLFLTLPLLIWSSIRYGMLGAAVISGVIIVSTVQLMALGLGPFISDHHTTSESVLELQSYLAVSIIASFFTALTVEKNNRHLLKLSDIGGQLQDLFEHSPVSLWVEDFSKVKQHIKQALSGSDHNLRSWLDNHPDQLPILAQKVSVVSVNKTTLELFGAHDQQELLANLNNIFNDDSLLTF